MRRNVHEAGLLCLVVFTDVVGSMTRHPGLVGSSESCNPLVLRNHQSLAFVGVREWVRPPPSLCQPRVVHVAVAVAVAVPVAEVPAQYTIPAS